MIYHDDGHGISKKSLSFFREHRHLVGEIKSVTMASYIDDEIVYPFRVIGEYGEIWLSGCTAGYMGEGPHTTVQIMRELDYPYDACQMVFGNREFQLGPPKGWKPKPVLKRRIPRGVSEGSAQEVLYFIEDYHTKHKIMPTAQEIKDGCDSISSKSIAHDRLHLLQDWGLIKIYKRKHRGIVLL